MKMYVHRERNLIYLAHPRTASTATAQFLKTRGFESLHGHHARLSISVSSALENRSKWKAFTVVRNHLDTIVSWAASYLETSKLSLGKLDMKQLDYIDATCDYVQPHSLWWMHSQEADVILRYERLEEGLSEILGEEVRLPFANVSRRRGSPHWKTYYDSKTEWYVRGRFKEEMQRYGYE